MYKTVAEIKAANKAAGQHFFEPATLRFFDSRIGRTVYRGRYFITSEAQPEGERRYTVRRTDDDGRIETVGGFHAYATSHLARHALYALLAGDTEAAQALAEVGAP